ncbi:MAG: formimidoylglutamase [Bacteroidota bacterium]|nr:formimidoylglutamase [Bacteroidota bacterium]
MDISIYFEPIDAESFRIEDDLPRKRLCDEITSYQKKGSFPDLENIDIVFFGVKEDRQSINNEGCSNGPDLARKYLYHLFQGNYKTRVADLGNINQGYSIDDTYFAVSSVVAALLEDKITPIIIGGSQDLTYAQYKGYENLGQIINMIAIDSRFDLGKYQDNINSQSYLSKIILHQPNYLFNFTNLGYQTYFIDQDAITLMQQLFFDTYRLGKVRENPEEVEPIVRNGDLLSIDVSAIRQSDAPGNGNASPNGFQGEEMCQIMRYAGLSDKMSSIGFYEYNPVFDKQEQTAQLIAQMIWYFIDGYYNRKNDYPLKIMDDYLKFLVRVKDHSDEIVFYKSKKSERWWMEVPIETDLMSKFDRHYMVPCSYGDYQVACEDTIPDRWWQFYHKLI